MNRIANKLFALIITITISNISTGQITWYQDSDSDGYGNILVTQSAASQPVGYVKNNIDCDDTVPGETAWGRLGKAGFSDVTPLNSNLDIAVGPTGTAYMIYLSGSTDKPTAMKKALGDSVWSVIDIPDFSTRDANPTQTVTNCAIAVDSKDTVWAALRKNGRLLLMRWHASANSGQWESIGTRISSINVSGVLDVVIGANDTPFVVYRAGSDRPRSQKMNPATHAWEYAAPGAAGEYIVNASIRPEFLTMAMNKEGVPYVAYKRTNSTGQNDYQAVVYKRNASADDWDLIGGTPASEGTSSGTRADSIRMAVDTSGNPYLIYSDYSNSRAGKGIVRRYNGSSWETVGTAGFTTGVLYMSNIVIDDATNDVYIAYADDGDEKLYVKRWTGSAWASVFDSSIASSVRSINMEIKNGILYVIYKDAANSNLACAKIYGPARIWKGTTSTDWNDALNWCGGDVPEDGDAVTFKATTTYEPSIPSGTINFRSLSIQPGDTLTVGSGSVLAVNGNFIVNGTVTGDGSIRLNSSLGSQSISGTGTVNNLELDNSNGAIIDTGSTLSITDTYTPTSGTLTTNSGFRLKSSATGTARIALGVGTYISGPVTVERYIPGGRRANRYFSHPFTTAQSISQLTGEIDITGSGGGANGFTGTSSNASSSWWYNPLTGDESTINDPGWTVFTTTAGGGSDDWNQYEAIKVLVRGAKGQGLNGQAYTPSPTNVTMTGDTINMGDQIVTLTKGTVSGYNLIGNPFPSQVDLSATVRDVNIEPNFWVWNPTGGTKGIFEANPFIIPYYLPAYSGFFARTVSNTNNTIIFQEAGKVSNTPAALFKTTTGKAPLLTEIRIENSSNVFWDKFIMMIDSNSTAGKEPADAAKFFNSEMNFYSFSSTHDSLAVDSRNYADSQIIKMDMWNGVKGDFILNVSKLGMPKGTSLYLEDSLLNTTVQLLPGTKYPFTTTNSGNTTHNRFYLRFSGKPEIDSINVPPVDTTNDTPAKVVLLKTSESFDFNLSPNPAGSVINIDIKTETKQPIEIRITNVLGREIYTGRTYNNNRMQLPLSQYPAGAYFITLTSEKKTMTKQFIKQ